MKKPSQTHRDVSVGHKEGFQLVKQVYRQVSKKNNVITSDYSSTRTTLIVEKVDRMERLIIDETATLVDDEGKPLTRVDSSGHHDSEDKVAAIDNDMANFLASNDVSYGTNSLLEQWKESYGNEKYDYDTKMICMKAMIFLTRFKIYAIIWILKFVL
nr:hypothetical protein [Tanacetum cinerariifolium]